MSSFDYIAIFQTIQTTGLIYIAVNNNLPSFAMKYIVLRHPHAIYKHHFHHKINVQYH